MIKITSQTTQNELIQLLLSKIPDQGNLYICVDSLPYFLSSKLSIKVFQFKVQNYPRSIFWYSNDDRILKILSNSEILNVGFPRMLEFNNPSDSDSFSLPQNPIVINSPKELKVDDKHIVSGLSSTDLVPKIEEQVEHLTEESQTTSQIFAQDFDVDKASLKPIDFEGLGLLAELKKNRSNANNSTKQDLNGWLQKIESTKSALTKHTENLAIKPELQESNFWTNFKKPFVYRSFLSFGLIGSIMLVLWIYPTNNYLLEIAPAVKQKTIEAQIPENIFNKTTLQLASNVTVDSSGVKDSLSTSRASGAVELVNSSLGVVEFNKDGIILIAEATGLEYSHKPKAGEPDTYSIKSNNNTVGQIIEIDIQAVESGEKYNLPKGSTLKVYNSQGQAMGSEFRAITKKDIKASPNNSETTVSENDYSLLRSKAEQNFLEQKKSQLQILQNENQITNTSWIQTENPKFEYSSPIGSNAKTVSITAKTSANFFSLPKDKLASAIQNQVNDKPISDITIVDTKLSNSTLDAKLFVSYVENPSISKKDVFNELQANANLDDLTQKLQTQYPNIKRLSKESQGISLPLVSPRNKVEINELNK